MYVPATVCVRILIVPEVLPINNELPDVSDPVTLRLVPVATPITGVIKVGVPFKTKIPVQLQLYYQFLLK